MLVSHRHQGQASRTAVQKDQGHQKTLPISTLSSRPHVCGGLGSLTPASSGHFTQPNSDTAALPLGVSHWCLPSPTAVTGRFPGFPSRTGWKDTYSWKTGLALYQADSGWNPSNPDVGWTLPTTSRPPSPSFSATHGHNVCMSSQARGESDTTRECCPDQEVAFSRECPFTTLLGDKPQREGECVQIKTIITAPVLVIALSTQRGADILGTILDAPAIWPLDWSLALDGAPTGHFSRRTHTPASQRWVPMEVTTSQLSMTGS